MVTFAEFQSSFHESDRSDCEDYRVVGCNEFQFYKQARIFGTKFASQFPESRKTERASSCGILALI
jgi:hypothetical protein